MPLGGMFAHEDEDEEEYRRHALEACAGAGGMHSFENVRRQIMRENKELKNLIQRIWNPKWGTRDIRNYDPKQLARGIKVEMEHTKNEDLAAEIAMDHLDEFPDYYKMIALMEEFLKQGIDAETVKDAVETY
jgi:hypothetical protein